MRYTINKINKGEDELILNYKEKNPEVEAVLLFMDKRQRKLIGRKNDETIVFQIVQSEQSRKGCEKYEPV